MFVEQKVKLVLISTHPSTRSRHPLPLLNTITCLVSLCVILVSTSLKSSVGLVTIRRLALAFIYMCTNSACLDLPTTKTTKPGKIQSVFLVTQHGLCPLEALKNLTSVVPAMADDPLFSWWDNNRDICPMVKLQAMEHVNNILSAWD